MGAPGRAGRGAQNEAGHIGPAISPRAMGFCRDQLQCGSTPTAYKRTVISALAACREDKIMCDDVTAAKAIVSVDARSRPIEEDVTGEGRLSGLGLRAQGSREGTCTCQSFPSWLRGLISLSPSVADERGHRPVALGG